jgi:hypothetical protein
MRYLLVIVAVVQFLLGVLAIVLTIRQHGSGFYEVLPGLLNAIAGLAGMRVGIRGIGHLGLILVNGVILSLVMMALSARHTLAGMPWRDPGVFLVVGMPAAAIIFSLMVGRPRSD